MGMLPYCAYSTSRTLFRRHLRLCRSMTIRTTFKTFIALAIAHTLVDSFGGTWSIFKYRAGLDLQVAGAFATVALLIGAAMQPIFGIWADHGHERRFVLLGAAFSSLGMLFGSIGLQFGAWGETTCLILLFVSLLLVRIGQGMFHPAGASVAGAISQQRRATFVAAFIASGMVGFAFCQLLYSWADEWLGGQTAWMLIPGSVVLLVGVFWMKPPRATERRPVEFRDVGKALHAVRGPLLAMYFIQVLMSAVHFAIFFLMPEFVESKGYPKWLIEGGAWMFFILGSAAIMVPMGYWADRYGRKRLIVVCLIGSAIMFYLLIASPQMPVPLFCLVIMTAGCFLNTINPLGVSLGQQLAPKNASVISGLLMGMAWAPASCAQFISGTLSKMDSLGPEGALLLFGILILPAIALALLLPGDHRSGGALLANEPLPEPFPATLPGSVEHGADVSVETK